MTDKDLLGERIVTLKPELLNQTASVPAQHLTKPRLELSLP
jgi:hypothetical protein